MTENKEIRKITIVGTGAIGASWAALYLENGPELEDFKVKLFADIDAATPPNSIIASSSSRR